MKKTLKTGKKALSVFMAALMLLTAWVFFAPEKAEAATAGKYDVKVRFEPSDGAYTYDEQMRVLYHGNNGTAGQTGKMSQDFKNDGNKGTMDKAYEYDFKDVPGYPNQVQIYCSGLTMVGGKLKYGVKVWVRKAGTSTWTLVKDSDWKEKSHSYNWGRSFTDTFDVWNRPYANSISWSWNNNETNLTVPKSGTVGVSTNSATVYDQYGVEWYQEPAYAYGSTSSPRNSSENISGVTLSTGTNQADTTNLSISNEIKDWVSNNGTGWQRTLYLNAYCGNAKSSIMPITITNCTYTATFVDGKTTETIGTKSGLYYNYTKPTEPSIDKPLHRIKDEDNHYKFTGWSPELAPIKEDTTFKAIYEAEPHTMVEIERHPSTSCIESGRGHVKYRCSVCGYEKTEPLDLLPHEYKVEKITEPTCTEKGYSYGHCKVCNHDENFNFVPALGHHLVISDKDTTAKCESAGKVVYYCDRKGCDYTETKMVDRLGHDFSNIYYGPEPTCTEAGREYHKCIRCEAFDPKFGGKDGVVAGKLGHDWGEWQTTKEETCTTDGMEKRTCKRNAAHTEERLRARTGHNVDRENLLRKEPTCTVPGYTYYKCVNKDCTYFEKVADLNPLGHDRDHATWKVTIEPKCEKAGREDLICGREGCSESLDNREVKPTGHEWGEYTKTKNATCTENAKQTAHCIHKDCTATNTIDIPDDPALGHKWGEYRIYSGRTCTENEKQIADCTRCGKAQDIKEIPGTALGHVYEKKIQVRVAKAEYCTTDRVIIIVCDRCNGAEKEYTVPNTRLGHDVSTWTHDEDTETCCDYGTKHGTCNRCGETDVVVDKGVLKPHVWGEWEHVEGSETCQKDGDKIRRCQNFCHNGKGGEGDAVQCEATETATDIGTRLEHNFPDPVTESELYKSNNDATCLRDGTKTATCKNEGCTAKKTIADPGSKGPHKFVTWISDGNATCTEDGTKHSYCMYGCGTLKKGVPDEGSRLGHNFRDWDYEYNKDATCESDGTRTAQCENMFPTGELDKDGNPIMKRCEETNTLVAEGTKLGHKWSEWEAVGEAADCTKGGTFKRHCENTYRVAEKDAEGNITGYKTVNCTKEETKTVEKLEHTYEWVITEDADGNEVEFDENNKPIGIDCTKGYYKVKKCSICGHVDETSKKLITGEHNFDVKITEPTCTKDGKKEIYCTVCGTVTKQETLKATGHINTEVDKKTAKAATCAEEGNTGDIICVACGEKVGEGETIPKTDKHTFTKYVKVSDATCTENEKEQAVCDVCKKATDTRDVPFTALGHEYDETKYEVKTKATCTEDEVREYRCMHFFTDKDGNEVQCENTKEVTVRNTATGHKWSEWTVIEEASCSKAGKAERKCLNSGCEVVITKTLRKLSHTPSDWIVDKEATCTTEGHRYIECAAGCGYIYEEEIIPKKPHDFEVTECTATCLDDGYSDYVCKVCKATKRGEIVKALGHDWSGTWVVTKEPTCTKKGTETLTCTRCTATQTRNIDALGHHEVIDPAVPATCTKEGLTEGSHCDRCGEILKKQETVVKPHYDGDGDGKCDECGKELKHSTDLNCDCICHKTFWLMRLQYKILRFFWKLFKIGKGCDCGAIHY